MTMEAEAIYAILQDVYGQSPWSFEQILADMAKEDTSYYFVWDKHMVGFLALQDLGEEAEITNIAVRKSYQRWGYGALLMKQLEKKCSKPVFLEVRAGNATAIRFYQKHGFERIGRRKAYYHDPVEDALLMRRNER